MAGPIPTKKIPQLTALGAPLQGNEMLEIWVTNTSRRVDARDFALPLDPYLMAVDYSSVFPFSRYLASANNSVTITDNGPGDTLDLSVAATLLGASFVTVGNEDALFPASRQIVQGLGIQITDNGPGGTLEIAMLGTGALPGNPTAQVGLAAVNGVANTWMRSDAAPPLDQSIAPTWTGNHNFTANQNLVSNALPQWIFVETDAAADNRAWPIRISGEQFNIGALNDLGSVFTPFVTVDRTGTTIDTINLQSTQLLHNGAPLAGGVTGLANPTATIGLTAVNGVAVTAMRSDAAPPLSQAIAPVWTGVHQFTRVGAFSTPTVWLSNTRPLMRFTETDASADNGNFYIDVSGETMRIAAIDDAGSTSNFFVQFDRTGAVLDDISFGCRTTMPRTAFVIAGAAQALDLRAGADFHLTLQNSPTISFTNPPAAGRAYTFNIFLLQDGTGSRTVTWPASVHWSDGITPVLTTTANRLDAVALTTYDGGVTYYGGQILANMVP